MGTLYIVATPIGNLKDITYRVIEVLGSVDYILCEDTRVAGKLLSHYAIKQSLISFNEFSENFKTGNVVSDIAAGKSVALISDAGSPLISDPGYKLVRECVIKGIKVEAIPGPSAAISALTVSGLPPDKFLFLGYLSKKQGKRKETLRSLFTILQTMMGKKLKPTVIIYESPYRLLTMLKDLQEVFGDVDIVVCRELTKIHEEVRREKVSEATEHFSKIPPKGELTILF